MDVADMPEGGGEAAHEAVGRSSGDPREPTIACSCQECTGRPASAPRRESSKARGLEAARTPNTPATNLALQLRAKHPCGRTL